MLARGQAVETPGQRLPAQVHRIEGGSRGRGMHLARKAAQRSHRRIGAGGALEVAGDADEVVGDRALAPALLPVDVLEGRFHPLRRAQRGRGDAGQAQRGGRHIQPGDVHPGLVGVIAQAGGEEDPRAGGQAGEAATEAATGGQYIFACLPGVAAAHAGHVHRAAFQRGGAGHLHRAVADHHGQHATGFLHVVADHLHAAGAEVLVDRHGAGIAQVATQPVGAGQARARIHGHRRAQRPGHLQGAGLHPGVAGVFQCRAAGAQHQGAAALLDQAAAAGDRVAPGRVATEVHRHVAPVEPGRAAQGLGHVEQAMAEHRVHARIAQVGGRAQQGLPDQVVVEVGKLLPDHGGRTGHQRRGIGGATAVVVGRIAGGVVGACEHGRARCDQAVVAGQPAGVGVVHQGGGIGGVQRGHRQPALLQVGRRHRPVRARLAGQRGHVGRVAARFVAGGEHHQAVAVLDEEAVLVGDRRGGRGPGPVQATPGVVHDPHAGVGQVLVDRLEPQRAGDLVALARTVVGGALVIDDPRRQDVRAWRHAAGPVAKRLPGRQLGHGGAMADLVVHAHVVLAAVDIDVVGQHPPGQRRMVAVDPGIDHADPVAGAGIALALAGGGVDQGQVRVDPGLDQGRWRRRGRGWRRRWRGRCHRPDIVPAPTATGRQAGSQGAGNGDGQQRTGQAARNRRVSEQVHPPLLLLAQRKAQCLPAAHDLLYTAIAPRLSPPAGGGAGRPGPR